MWPDAISLWMQQRKSTKFYTNLAKCATETMTIVRLAFGEESMSHTRKYTLTENEKGEKCEEQSQEHAHYFS
jgi:hypothetical protein